MRPKVLALFVITILLFICACSKSKDDNSYTYPLKVGNSWTYQRTFYDPDPNLPPYVGIIKASVDSILTSPSGQECYRMRFEEIYEGESYFYDQYLANLPEGLCSLGGGRGIFNIKGYRTMIPLFSGGKKAFEDGDSPWFRHPHLLIPKNPEVGFAWIQPKCDDWLEVHYLMKEPETVVTDIGTFKCHVKRSQVNWDSRFDDYELFDYYSSKGLAKFLSVDTGILPDQDGQERQEEILEEVRLIACDLK